MTDQEKNSLEKRIAWAIGQAGPGIFDQPGEAFDSEGVQVAIHKIHHHGRRKIFHCKVKVNPAGKNGKTKFSLLFEEMDGILRVFGDFC